MSSQSIVFTNDNCIGCNRCINVCSAIGACVSGEVDGKARIHVDGSKCIACGSCMDVCVHNAREYVDDTEAFFADLKKGEPISLLLAPAFKANYPNEYESVLGGLKELGARRIISVSFGADITTWGYLNYIDRYDFTGGISQPCPAVVSYIERYLPELIPKLFPVQSPLMCAAVYARKKLGVTDRLAFISPCIAKKLEIEDPHNKGLVQYNVTFDHLMRYIREHGIKGDPANSEIEYGLGSYYPTPGGLAENVRWFLGDSVYIRQIEGERHLYEWMHENASRIKNNETPFLFIDALNCEKGCICGTAVNPEKSRTDDALYSLLDIREASKNSRSGMAWSKSDTPEERLKNFNDQFSDLKLSDFLRGYTDRSAECAYDIPNEEELDAIFLTMNKVTDESRKINCTCCGYNSCIQMATAIHNGFNHRENCIYYEKTMVQELAIEKSVAEAATKAKSSFLANMSHEIRTPINAVLGMNEMILRECQDANIIAYSESIRSAGDTLLGLVNNILDFSKIEAGKMDITPVEYDLSSVINDLVNMIQIRADNKGLLLSLDFDPDIPKILFGDEIRVKQIITNLLTNAVKYTPKGTITFSMKHSETDDPAFIDLNVSVKDTGIGIKPEDLKLLFEKFSRIEEERNRNIEGTGLGMNITQKLLELMGSSLEVESEYGQGSRFSFSVRQRVIRRELLGDYQSAYRKLLSQRKTYRRKFTAPDAMILVIDDNPMNLTVFKSLLKQTLVQIDTASGGDEGLTLSLDKKYDIIFFDHMMPEKDGIETLHELKAQSTNPNLSTPSVCLTANAVSGAREQYLSEGFDDYLTKPIDSSKLEEMLIYYLPEDKVQLSVPDITEEEADKEEDIDGRFAVLADVPGMNISDGITNSGDADSYMGMLRIFYDSIDENTVLINNFYETGDLKNYAIKVHALKSSARIIGANELGEEAQALETAGKEGDESFVRRHHVPFMERYASMRSALAGIFEASAADDALPEADSAKMEEIYERLYSGADDMDTGILEDAFEEMKAWRIPDSETDIFNRLHEAFRAYDYDSIIEILKQRKQ
ncbi:MAG: response regulator [Lachnospiraceae bacterium]|nr:response regulator [Lachnospiraceae bacterium]